MAPILNEVSVSMNDKIQVVKIDTEKYPSIADKYKIEALPTFILFKDGEPCDRFVSLILLVFLFCGNTVWFKFSCSYAEEMHTISCLVCAIT